MFVFEDAWSLDLLFFDAVVADTFGRVFLWFCLLFSCNAAVVGAFLADLFGANFRVLLFEVEEGAFEWERVRWGGGRWCPLPTLPLSW